MKTIFRISFLLSLAVFANTAYAQSKLEQFFQDTMKRVVGEQKFNQLKATTKGINFLNRSWDVTDTMGGKNKITTTANGACFERPSLNYKVCSDLNGVETTRTGFNGDKNANGEYAAIIATPTGLIIDWAYRDCSTGYVQTWAMGNQLLSNNMGPVNTSSRQEPARCESQ
jgi:hypothetical protein